MSTVSYWLKLRLNFSILFVFLVVFVFTTNTYSRYNYKKHSVLNDVALFPTFVSSSDIDGDGDIDLVTASERDDKIAWYENDGNENFTPHVISTNADSANCALIADFDGDGDEDIISSSFKDAKIAWYKNDGSENFETIIITTDVSKITHLSVGDIDDDGDIDFAASRETGDNVSWYENDGSGIFTLHPIDNLSSSTQAVSIVDIDGDGDKDIISGNSYIANDYALVWYKNDGSENFTAHHIDSTLDNIMTVKTADIDNDGDIDVVAGTDFSTEGVVWYSNEGSGQFTKDTVDISATYVRSLDISDIDKDNDLDVIFISENKNDLIWAENDSIGNFTSHLIADAVYGATWATAVDLNEDGEKDIISTSGDDNRITWFENDGSESFSEHVITEAGREPEDIFAVDVDNDGDNDIIAGYEISDNILLHVNDGNGNFKAQTITSSTNRLKSVYAADLDKNGYMDILSASYYDDKIAWYKNDGAGNYTENILTTSANGANTVSAVDMNGDSAIDVLASSYEDDKIAWYKNDGTGNFTEQIITTSENAIEALTAGDIDGDGDTDLLVGKYLDSLIWYKNDGTGTFSTHLISDDINQISRVLLADLDNDNDLDVIAGGFYRYIHWYRNDGSGNFTADTVHDYTFQTYAFDLITDDVDNDGDYDIVAARNQSDRVDLFINDGTGSFSPHVIDSNIDAPHAVFSADMDKDGDKDIIVGSGLDDQINWNELRPTLMYPTKGATLGSGSTETIKWVGKETSNLMLSYSTDSGATWNTISSTVPNHDSLNWDIPDIASATCFLRIGNSSTSEWIDTTDSVFTIGHGTITVTCPQKDDEEWRVGHTKDITWTSTGEVGTVSIWKRLYYSDTWEIIDSNVVNNGSYSWKVTGNGTAAYYLKVASELHDEVFDVSDYYIGIYYSYIVVSNPNGGEILKADSTHEIFWYRNGYPADLRIEYSTDGGSSWGLIVDTTKNDSYYDWVVPNTVSNECLIRISYTDGDPIDVSDAFFSIDNSTAIEDKDETLLSKSLIIGPNPVKQHSKIYAEISPHQDILFGKATLFDHLGHLIDQKVFKYINKEKPSKIWEWNCKNLSERQASKGAYILVISVTYADGSKESTKRIIGVK